MNQVGVEKEEWEDHALEGGAAEKGDKGAANTAGAPKKDGAGQEEKKELTPEEKAEKAAKAKAAHAKAGELLKSYIGKHKCLMGFGLVLNLAGMVGEFVTPLFIGKVVDAIVAKDYDHVNTLVWQWMVFNAAGSIMQGLQRFLFQLLTEKIGMALREDLFREILSKDCEFFDSRKTGDLLSRLSADTAKIENALSSQVSVLIKSLLYILVVFVMFFIISWQMALFTIGVMLPTLCAGPIYGRFMQKMMKDISDGKAEASNVAEEAFSNIRTVKAFATEDRECLAYQVKNDYIYSKAACQAMGYGAFSFFMQFVMFGSLDALIYFAAVLVLDDVLTIGDFTSFQFYMFSFLINFMTMASVVGEVMGVLGTTAAIAEIFLHKSKINTSGGNEVTQETIVDGAISLTDIQFTYPTKKDIKIIKEAAIVVGKNKTVALVGSSGCGKSTIIQLVERFYDPDAGSVKYGNQDLKDLNPESYKCNLAIVQQEPVLFSGSIRENIAYGLKKEPTNEELDEACRQANALQFIQDKNIFPQGYDTLVGERGIKLSGGQKQRVAIARALIRKPKVLLLDEATSALDAESEHQVQQALDAVLQNGELSQTVIVVAHRLSTIKDADEIIVLKKGLIVERGNHQQLLEKGGDYKALVERQLMSADGM